MTDGHNRSERPRLLTAGALFRNYVVAKPIAAGGFGEVWLVYHSTLKTQFALKVVSRGMMSTDPDAKDRFLTEVRLAAKIRHPSILAVYDAGLDKETGLYFCVMDFMPCGTVADRIAKARRLSVDESVRIARMVAEGLEELRRRSIVHRDVKPSNMLLASDGTVKLSDLGIALDAASGGKSKDAPDFALGTPLYMPKEQIENSQDVDSRADVYSLGVTLFEMLTGKCPGSGLSVDDLFRSRINGERLPNIKTVNRAIPAKLATLIERMTEPDRDKRISGPKAVLDALDDFVRDRARQPVARRRQAVVGALRLALAAAGGVLAFGLIVAAAWWDGIIGFSPGTSVEGEGSAPLEVSAFEEGAEDDKPRDFGPERVKIVYVTNTVEVMVRDEPQPRTRRRRRPSSEASAANAPGNNGRTGAAESSVASESAQVTPRPTPAPQQPPAPPEISDEDICGITVRHPSDAERAFGNIRDMIVAADAETRKLRGIAGSAPVQTGVRTVVLLSDDSVESSYDKKGRTLTVGRRFAENKSKLARIVVKFMTSAQDAAREPFYDDISAYVRLRVLDAVLPGDCEAQAQMEDAVQEAMSLERKYGVCDYDGKVVRYGTKLQRVPVYYVAAHRRGHVFDILKRADMGSDGLVIGRYFAAKRLALSKGHIGVKMNDSDFAALLSIACGKDLFQQLRELEWSVSSMETRVKVGRMERGMFFGR